MDQQTAEGIYPLIIHVPGYKGPERRKTLNEWRIDVEKRLHDGAVTMQRTESKVDENTLITKDVANSTREIVDAFKNAKGAFRVLESLAKVARPLTALLVFAGAIWAFVTALKSGHPPTPPN